MRHEWPSHREWGPIDLFSVDINLAPRPHNDVHDRNHSGSSHQFHISFNAEYDTEGGTTKGNSYLLGRHWLRRVDIDHQEFGIEAAPHNSSVLDKGGATSTADLTMAMKWLKHCLKSHLTCEPDNRPLVPPPSRLVHLAMRGDQITSRLIERDEFPRGCQYITLSHCWGSGPMHSLRSDRLDGFKTKIPVSQLPLTFQNAFDVTLRLGYEYIWIDSLCILQDALEEWAEEASKMADIYEFSVCNIAATAFKSSSSGFFIPKPADIDKPLVVSVDLKLQPGLEMVGKFKFIETYYWVSRVDKAPLNKRAWVLQERFFSPRILHFGKDQLLWECDCSRACELMPKGLFSTVRNSAHRGHTTSRALAAKSRQSVKRTWYNLVWEYTVTDLTYPSDKLIGIAGITKRFETILEDVSIAGLWSESFPGDLLWCREWRDRERLPRANDGRAPTWYVIKLHPDRAGSLKS
ncbi:HET-domain-containing protein [Aaosphaeria arxii CBS 175.79]|uniref:HET-domain-containing protein n=1 Tax=Aaosphaeria arxii CBS 175.79 TaxID=1450172 RepID=A0A6A5Y437_9PLEO|nr:HET-domain-containing protein [Aaosphaeria arxii CBS 175.79]KAF2019641.1 HET-domain-containing protein [Aaosphaeria arxii CBS 175.79]